MRRIKEVVPASILTVTLACAPAGARRASRLAPPSEKGTVVHGTINVLLGNGNGLVVLTDSMLTRRNPDGTVQQLGTPGKKLFRLNERVVCTIAGFISADVWIPEVEHTIASIVQSYANELETTASKATVSEMGEDLTFLIENQLSLVASEMNIPGFLEDKPLIEVTLAGYDPNGAASIQWYDLQLTQGGPYYDVTVIRRGNEAVKRDFVAKTRGITDVADAILNHPDQYGQDPAVARYAASRSTRAVLTIPELRALALALADRTADRYREVGGDHQVAVFENGRITAIEQRLFPAEAVRTTPFEIHWQEQHFCGWFTPQGDPIHAQPPRTLLFVDNIVEGCIIILDGGYFAANTFGNCLVVYKGGKTRFVPNNFTGSSTLLISKGVDLRSSAVKQLMIMPWGKIRCQGEMNEACPANTSGASTPPAKPRD